MGGAVEHRVPVKEPVQARSRDSADRVLEATLRILARDGPAALTIARVAAESETSNGSIFHRFGNRRTLLLAALDLFVDRVRALAEAARADAAGRSLDLDATIAALVDRYVLVFRLHGSLIRAFVLEAAVDPDTAVRGAVGKAVFAEQVSAAFAAHVDALALADPATTFALVHRVVFGACVMRVLFDQDDPFTPADVAALRDAVSGMLRPRR